MSKTVLMPLLGILAGAVLLALAGCASPPTHFYVLSPLSFPAQAGGAAAPGLAVGLGPVDFPNYLDRSQIVTRTSQNQIDLADFAHWGEPLQDNFIQVLAENLALLLPSQQVSVYPWKRATPIAYQVRVKVIRFDRTNGADSVLEVRWSIISGDGAQELANRASSYAVLPSGDDYPAIVAAMNQTVALFSRDIANALRSLPRPLRPAPIQ